MLVCAGVCSGMCMSVSAGVCWSMFWCVHECACMSVFWCVHECDGHCSKTIVCMHARSLWSSCSERGGTISD